jgi:hypothetical protein
MATSTRAKISRTFVAKTDRIYKFLIRKYSQVQLHAQDAHPVEVGRQSDQSSTRISDK